MMCVLGFGRRPAQLVMVDLSTPSPGSERRCPRECCHASRAVGFTLLELLAAIVLYVSKPVHRSHTENDAIPLFFL